MVETLKGERVETVPYDKYKGEVQRTMGSKEIGSSWAIKEKRKLKKHHPWR